jgi:alkylation response protein AidB-like acyl-CoA dehydrogenase
MTAGEDDAVTITTTEDERSSAGEALVANLIALSQLGRGRPSDEQAQLRQTLRRFLQSKSPEAQVRADMDSELGYDPAIWRQLSDQVGVPGLNVPERFGGAGATEAEMFIALEEMGRALYCSPYFGTVVLCLTTLLRSGDEDLCSEVVPGIISGDRTAALAVAEGDGDIRRTVFEMEARSTPAGWRLTGAKSFVIDGLSADDLIIAAQCEGEPLLFWVSGDAEGLVRTRLRTLDPTRQLADLQLRDVAARQIKTGSAPVDILAWVAAVATVAQAAEQVGGAELCLESAVEYAKVRRQFGRPIGAFQAVKHKCADMLIAVESARSLAQCAYGSIVRGGPVVELAASLAGPGCSDAFTRVAADHIQVLGGLGFTWEHHAHLYYRRAMSASLLFGTSSFHQDRAAHLLGLAESLG